jgi:hypothetical protein
MKLLLRLFGNLALFLLSQVMGLIMIPLGIIWGFGKAFWKRRWRTGVKIMADKFITIAASFDKYGGIVCAEFLNDTMITKDSVHKFGDKDNFTISKDYGLNDKANTLTKFGKFWVKVLNKLDRNHTNKAVEAKSKL